MDQNQQQSLPQQPVQPVPQQVQAPVGKSNSLKKGFLTLFGIMILLAVAGGSYYVGTQQSSVAKGSHSLNLLQKLTNQTEQKLPDTVHTLPTATPTPDPTANWQAYTNTKYTYSIRYPEGFSSNEVNTYYHYVEFKPSGSSGALPPFLVAVIADTFTAKDVAAYNYMSSDWINNIANIAVGQTKTMDQAASFVRLPDTKVAGQTATAIEVTATGFKQHRVYVRKNGYIYMLSNYYQTPAELNNFNLFVSTFKFTQ